MDEAMALQAAGNKRCSVAATAKNDRSNRAHRVFIVTIAFTKSMGTALKDADDILKGTSSVSRRPVVCESPRAPLPRWCGNNPTSPTAPCAGRPPTSNPVTLDDIGCLTIVDLAGSEVCDTTMTAGVSCASRSAPVTVVVPRCRFSNGYNLRYVPSPPVRTSRLDAIPLEKVRTPPPPAVCALRACPSHGRVLQMCVPFRVRPIGIENLYRISPTMRLKLSFIIAAGGFQLDDAIISSSLV